MAEVSSALRSGQSPTAAAQLSRPALRWFGGKWLLAPWVASHFPSHKVYVEPFGGAASVLLRKPRSYAEIYNDLDDEVVNLFQVLRSQDAARLVDVLRLTPFSEVEFKQAYQRTADPVERARRLIVRSYMGFGANGCNFQLTGFRSNSNRFGTTPAHDWANYPDALLAIVDRLTGVVISQADAVAVMAKHDSADTLHYVDPPYVHATRSKPKHHGYAHEMDNEAHHALLSALKALRGMVVISGYPHQLYDDALPGWQRIARAALADGARARTEVLWLNPACADALDRSDVPLFAVGA